MDAVVGLHGNGEEVNGVTQLCSEEVLKAVELSGHGEEMNGVTCNEQIYNVVVGLLGIR